MINYINVDRYLSLSRGLRSVLTDGGFQGVTGGKRESRAPAGWLPVLLVVQ
jgi:hypothetical protein